MDIDGLSIGTFLFFVIAILGLCIGVSMLIMARISDDKENSILKQVWETFFGKHTPPTDDSGQQE